VILRGRTSGKDEQRVLIGSSALTCRSQLSMEGMESGHSKGGRSSSNG
jgi:hypothetical protein